MVIAKEFDQLGWELYLYSASHTSISTNRDTLGDRERKSCTHDIKNSRSIEKTLNQLIEAFYSSEYKRKKKNIDDAAVTEIGITKAHCAGLIRESIKWINEFILTIPDLLTGDVDNLSIIDHSLAPPRNVNDMNRMDRGSPEELALAIRAHASKQMNSQPAAASSFDDSLEAARIDALRQIENHSDEQEEELDDESDDESEEELDKEEMIDVDEEYDYEDEDEQERKGKRQIEVGTEQTSTS